MQIDRRRHIVPTRTALRLRRPLRLQQRSSSARSPPRAVNRRSPRDRATRPPRASVAGGRRRRPSRSRPECRRAAWARVADRRASRSCRETPTIITERQPAATKRRARSGRPEEPDPRHSRRPLPPAIAGVGSVRRRASKSSGAGACERHVETPLSHVMRASAVSMPALSRVVPCCGLGDVGKTARARRSTYAPEVCRAATQSQPPLGLSRRFRASGGGCGGGCCRSPRRCGSCGCDGGS